MTAPRFDTADYKRSHGKEPRGTGQWAFRAGMHTEFVFSPSMSYADAKKWVREQFPTATYFEVGA